MLSLSSSWPSSKRSGWETGTEMVVDMPVTALLVSAPVPTLFTVMLATPPVKPALGVRLKLTSRVDLGAMVPR